MIASKAKETETESPNIILQKILKQLGQEALERWAVSPASTKIYQLNLVISERAHNDHILIFFHI